MSKGRSKRAPGKGRARTAKTPAPLALASNVEPNSVGSAAVGWTQVQGGAALRFAVIFLACAGGASLLYAYSYASGSGVERGLERYLAGYARAAGALLALFDSAVHVSGTEILGRFPLRIVKDCDAMEVKILFGGAVLAFPAFWWRRALGLVAGIALLFATNLIRICSLYFVGIHAPSAFEAVHREVWPLLMIGVASALFLIWVRWAMAGEDAARVHSG